MPASIAPALQRLASRRPPLPFAAGTVASSLLLGRLLLLLCCLLLAAVLHRQLPEAPQPLQPPSASEGLLPLGGRAAAAAAGARASAKLALDLACVLRMVVALCLCASSWPGAEGGEWEAGQPRIVQRPGHRTHEEQAYELQEDL